MTGESSPIKVPHGLVRGISLFLLSVLGVLGLGLEDPAEACRRVDRPPALEHVFWVHVEGHCSLPERQKWAVPGSEILLAIQQGKHVDLQGVLVTGDVMLDQLPLQRVSEVSSIPAQIQADLDHRHIQEVRIIPGSLRIRETEFEKVLATNLSKGALVILGEVDLSDSVFVQSVDFSKSIFVQPARFTGMRVDFEGFFIGSRFTQEADFSNVRFGTHSRFHKAVFQAPVTFEKTQFKGVAEFLEVIFQREANFSHTVFSSGTGFSGSVFQKAVDFSDAVFTHEIYFRFSDFQDRIEFTRTDFQKVVDFSNSHFVSPADFTDVSFVSQPEHTGSNLALPPLTRKGWNHPAVQLVIAGCLLLLIFLHQWRYGKKHRRSI